MGEAHTFMGLKGTSLSVAISLAAGFSFFLFGYDQGDMGGLITVDAFRRTFPAIDTITFNDLHHAQVQGITVAAWNIGCFVSAILTIFIGDMLGRKKTIILGISILIIGEIIQASSYSLGQLIAGRVIAGFGNGFNTSTVPAWQAECTKAHRRGTVLMITAGTWLAAGLASAYWITFGFGWLYDTSAAWRVPIAIQLVFALGTIGLYTQLPESPRWLVLTGREDAALRTLSALNDVSPQDPDIHDEFLAIKDAVLQMASGTFAMLFSNDENRYLHRVLLAYCVQIFQQLSGINVVTQYLAMMFVLRTEYTGWVARLLAACSATTFLAASLVAVVGIDRFWGRRWLMMFGAGGMCASMVILAIMAYVGNTGAHAAQAVFIFVYVCFFAMGWQAMSWLYSVEITPLRIRGPANALSTSANWIINFVMVLISPIAFYNIGYKTYIIFAVTNCVIIPIVYFFYPETAYRCLEEVDVIFHAASLSPKPWLTVVNVARDEPLWYGKDGEANFEYEQSEWHRQYMEKGGEKLSSSSDER
ncbi:MAG: hypothetical protein M1822_001718 [Bathelium mastoideum]|nr:MAG: hypothetical protein M1822_001718 [Bathelium mastoideum]